MLAYYDKVDKEPKCLLRNGERADILYFLLELQKSKNNLNDTDKKILDETITEIKKTYKKVG
ncbi:hypothetical protein [Vallitalea maricola]|uniref:Uncharacterized protein n=1 Tax=Vallitalea maricola TaxID=3074433 RepID=A0ACB5UFE6_9FIRM|nr:hypothetical protein AN2V17_04040 [Vallitalea sp. AN17-2]